jgi:hypothetical protein
LTRLDDSDWKHLIPNVGVRIELQTAITRKMREEQVEVRSTFFRKGLPKTIKEELQPMSPLPKITSFFSRASQNVLDLPDEQVLPQQDEHVISQEDVVILS